MIKDKLIIFPFLGLFFSLLAIYEIFQRKAILAVICLVFANIIDIFYEVLNDN